MDVGDQRDPVPADDCCRLPLSTGAFDLPHPVAPARIAYRFTSDDAATTRVLTPGGHRTVATSGSNTILDAGDGTLWKVYRRVDTTTAREGELLRHLEAVGRTDTPRLRHRVTIDAGGRELTVAVLLSRIPDYQCLGTALQSQAIAADDCRFVRAAGPLLSRLGYLVCDLHDSLVRPGPLRPPPVDPAALRDALRHLVVHAAHTVEPLRADPPWPDLVAGAHRLVDGRRLRRGLAVGHGDLHLFQVGIDSDGSMYVIDFEGETSRAPGWPSVRLAVREYDLAGIFTSLLHLLCSAGRRFSPGTGSLHDALYRRFLTAYLDRQHAIDAAPIDLELVQLLHRYRLLSEACLGGDSPVAGQAASALLRLSRAGGTRAA